MSQYQQPPEYQDQYAGMGDVPTKTSGLAVGALICSLIFCCPVTTLLGVLLGLIALVTIGKDPTKKGRGLAWTAIILGVIFTLLTVALLWWSVANFSLIQRQGPQDALAGASAGDYAAFREAMVGDSATATDEQIKAFIDELESRYGAFVSCQMDDQRFNTERPSIEEMMKPNPEYPYTLRFENETVDALIQVTPMDPNTGEFQWRNKFGVITVFDPDRGNITFPPDATPLTGYGLGEDGAAGGAAAGDGSTDASGDGSTGDGEQTGDEDAETAGQESGG